MSTPANAGQDYGSERKSLSNSTQQSSNQNRSHSTNAHARCLTQPSENDIKTKRIEHVCGNQTELWWKECQRSEPNAMSDHLHWWHPEVWAIDTRKHPIHNQYITRIVWTMHITNENEDETDLSLNPHQVPKWWNPEDKKQAKITRHHNLDLPWANKTNQIANFPAGLGLGIGPQQLLKKCHKTLSFERLGGVRRTIRPKEEKWQIK